MDRKPLGTQQEVATYLGVAESTLEQWRWRKTGPRWSKVGRYVRYRWSDIDKWLDAQAYDEAATGGKRAGRRTARM